MQATKIDFPFLRDTSFLYAYREGVFGYRREPHERMEVMAKLCEVFNQMYALGWRSVGGGSFDVVKRRRLVIFKYE